MRDLHKLPRSTILILAICLFFNTGSLTNLLQPKEVAELGQTKVVLLILLRNVGKSIHTKLGDGAVESRGQSTNSGSSGYGAPHLDH